jgi:hypothetical protein
MNPHTSEWAPTLEVGVPMDFRIFKGKLQGSKFIGLKISLQRWKVLGMKMFEMGSHDPFAFLKHKLWPKEGRGVKLAIGLSTTKSQKLPSFTCVKVECHISLENF